MIRLTSLLSGRGFRSNTFLCSYRLSLATTNCSVSLSVNSPFMDMTTSSNLLAALHLASVMSSRVWCLYWNINTVVMGLE